eukprot:scaffold297367_cov35-Tisochrysis_lutea.AAC.1
MSKRWAHGRGGGRARAAALGPAGDAWWLCRALACPLRPPRHALADGPAWYRLTEVGWGQERVQRGCVSEALGMVWGGIGRDGRARADRTLRRA